MFRSLLTLLVLLHYLLVSCASVAERGGPAVGRAFAYVHSPDCQLKNAWRGGNCFDDCNGVQYQVHKNHKPLPLHQLVAAAKGVDLHCLPLVAGGQTHLVIGLAAQPSPGSREDQLPGGVRGKIYAPPRLG